MTMIETETKPIKKPRAGEIYKCSFYEETIGSEIKGPRPVVVISENWYNEEGNRVICLPLTRYFNKQGQPRPFYA
jgi:mRNA-degrading endonuclease toxin of MazEF toxin-antitoxin module